MNNVIRLEAKNFEAEKQKIESSIKSDPWFVLDNRDLSLDEYITNLHDQYELGNKAITRLKICRNISWKKGDVTVLAFGDQVFKPNDIFELLQNFPDGQRLENEDPDKPLASIIIENNDRKLLANIAQQLIYLAYPLAEIDIRRRSEFQDAESVRRLMQNIDELAQSAQEASKNLAAIVIPRNQENTQDMADCKQNAIDGYKDIQEQIAKARKLEMKVAVAASKKTGKSVIVNCILGQELAPTSLEMATPNSCVYRKSPDDNYHLIWDKESEIYKANPGKFRDGTFATREEIYRAIDKEFKAAQKDRENKFLIPDMIVEYVSNGNNFESYTIHDTPGPDAAGTEHAKSAMKAMKECDASIFAIDYAKYLTQNEEEYLANVKQIFEEKNKFHTLLFDINKLDLALQDSGVKSRVKSIDFIRNRLIAINDKYEDCIIFATSALDYFNTITLENAASAYPELEKLLEPDANWNSDLDEAMDEIEDGGRNINETDLTALSNLQAETGRLKRMLGYKQVNLHNFREFSGIPQMMGYLGYILQSKAREEIVNYIAVTIDLLSGKINDIIHKGSNLLNSLQWNESQIENIRRILEEYSNKVKSVLDKRITQDDMAVIRDDNQFADIIETLHALHSEFTFDNILAAAKNRLKDSFIHDERKNLWNMYSDAQLVHLKELKKTGIVSRYDLPLPASTMAMMLKSRIDDFKIKIIGYEEEWLKTLGNGLKIILDNRFQKIREAVEECRKKLDKENCSLELPELPTFAVDFPEPVIPPLNIDVSGMVNELSRSPFFVTLDILDKAIENIKKHTWKVWEYEGFEDKVNLSKSSDEAIDKIVETVRQSFDDFLDENKIMSIFANLTGELGQNSIASQERLLHSFYALNDICKSAVDDFATLVDERSFYEHKAFELKNFLAVIKQIEAASERFMEIWRVIKPASVEKKEVAA